MLVKRPDFMEMLMRLAPVALCLAIAAATIASTGQGQPAKPVDPRSAALVQQAVAHGQAGRHSEAVDLLETALAVDPRNREALLALARIAQAQNLPGKAIRYYAEALELEPNDLNALAGQGEAYVQRGAVDRARRNLERVRTLCRSGCAQATALAASIERGPPPRPVAATAPTPTTVPPPTPRN